MFRPALFTLSVSAAICAPAAELVRAEEDDRKNIFGESAHGHWDPDAIIATDRPDFTDVLSAVPEGGVQFETGYTFHSVQSGADQAASQHTPEALMRVGMLPKVEARLSWDASLTNEEQGIATANADAVVNSTALTLGVKWQAINQQGWLPGHTLMATVGSHFNTGDPSYLQPGLNYIYGHQLTPWFMLRGSTGIELRREHVAPTPATDIRSTGNQSHPNHQIELHQSAVGYYQVLRSLGAFTEWFAFFHPGGHTASRHFVASGVYIYATPHILFDARIGKSVAGANDEWFTGTGFSTRIGP